MTELQERWAIGLMSGTSLDGIDGALILSDGRTVTRTGPSATVAYDSSFRASLRAQLGRDDPDGEVVRALTERHGEIVARLLAAADLPASEIAVVGFHGQTLWHRPEQGRTCQIGDGARLAHLTGIDVVSDFRSQDMAAGGEGAPFAPLYHAALAAKQARPLAVLNLGGVGNVTWIGPGEDNLLAFDTGPGNALIDDWVQLQSDQTCDLDGRLAASGRVDQSVLERMLQAPYFERSPPKSLDRDDFDGSAVANLSLADGAATLTAFTAAAVSKARDHMAIPPGRWLVTGGGRRNPALMAALCERLDAAVDPVEAVGWDGDALEAQAFAYLALRSIKGLPLSLPGTTGARRATTGGVLHRAA
ncbi:MAG: anhydro-N-acetylmuramic acid kinase [Pseudomonadota bacterium]